MFIKFNLDGLLRGSYKERMEGYAVGIQNGFFSVNDVRGLEDMNPAPFGDVYRANGNMRSLESLDNAGKMEEGSQ